ncbi:Translation initiation factor IF-2 protein [Marine Group I thaumarchaeote SCGC AAA799-E16]|uniref:Translation initiation factor IF-2 protein n=1 Tax=Marine Group I thaumarchaeote SCGC AAA799-E16 TaxID=1502292 RepID=A0A081S674_9ARCH|nr:Translation initiation factor IF-2 protein [Marine Group I thaumarchaeote SCGC AAA799-E16]
MQKLSGIFLLTVLFLGALFSSFAFAQEGPIAEDDFYTVDEDSLLIVDPIGVLQNDTNITNNPLNAILLNDVNFGTLTFNQNGNFTYLPNENSVVTDSFTYVANNGTHNSNDATVIIFVNPINDAPVAQNDFVETQQNVPISIDVLENDSDVDNDPLNIFLEIDPSETRGFVEIQESQVLFTPLAGFVGNATFSYVASDGEKTSNSANVTISVIEVDEEPNDSLFEQIFEQIQLIFDKVLVLEDEVTQLKEENALLEERISVLEAFHRTDTSGHNEKVTICHKGKNTITISTNALPAHLNHGDTKGKCSDIVSSNSFSTLTTSVTPQTTFSNERVDICHNGKVTLSLPGNAARHHLEHHDDDYLGQCTDSSTANLKAERESERLSKQETKKQQLEAQKVQRENEKAQKEAERLAKQQAEQQQREAEKAQKEAERLAKLESKEKGSKFK